MRITELVAVGVVVADLEKARTAYARLLDINEWTLGAASAETVTDQLCHGRRTGGTYDWAFGRTPFDPAGEVMGQPQRAIGFELIQPTGGETPFHEYLLGVGEGICFLTVLDADADPAGAAAHFEALGIRALYRETGAGGVRTFWDTRAALGGYLLEVVSEHRTPSGQSETLDGAALRAGRPALPATGVLHFGVIVPDLMAAIDEYHRVLGIEKFAVKTWQTEPGRLDTPYYRDHSPVEHGYFTAQGFCADFGFEIIQIKYGPSHYNREFADDRGAGIHHLYTFFTTDAAAWAGTTAALTELGAPLVMGSELRGKASEYGYYDTFEGLGFLVEGVHRRHPAEPRYMAPDFEVDFTTREA